MSDDAPRVLVVDADDDRRRAWCAALAAAGLDPEGLPAPPQAIVAARRAGVPPPALLAADAALPGLGPALLARALRSLPGLGGLPLLVLGGPVPAGLERCAAAAETGAAGAAALALLAGGAPAPAAAPSADGAAEEPVLDPAVVARVRGYGEQMFQQLVGQYLDELPQRLEQTARALAGGDLKAAGAIAHALKGSSGSLGMRRLWRGCAELDRACREGGGAEAAGRALAAVRELAGESAAAMRGELARPGGGP